MEGRRKKMKFEWKALPVLALAILIPSLASAQYTRTDLVTNSGAGGTVQDFHLINGWGLVSTSTSPFWVSDNGTGFSTLYAISNAGGTVTATPLGLVVSVPSVAGGPGTPTGIVATELPAGSQAKPHLPFQRHPNPPFRAKRGISLRL